MMVIDDRTEDMAAAIEILGWTDVRDDVPYLTGVSGRAPQPLGGDTQFLRGIGRSIVPRFGEYMEPAMMIVTGMVALGWSYQIGNSEEGPDFHEVLFCRDLSIHGYRHIFIDSGSDLPRAIRSAALKAVRADLDAHPNLLAELAAQAPPPPPTAQEAAAVVQTLLNSFRSQMGMDVSKATDNYQMGMLDAINAIEAMVAGKPYTPIGILHEAS